MAEFQQQAKNKLEDQILPKNTPFEMFEVWSSLITSYH